MDEAFIVVSLHGYYVVCQYAFTLATATALTRALTYGTAFAFFKTVETHSLISISSGRRLRMDCLENEKSALSEAISSRLMFQRSIWLLVGFEEESSEAAVFSILQVH